MIVLITIFSLIPVVKPWGIISKGMLVLIKVLKYKKSEWILQVESSYAVTHPNTNLAQKKLNLFDLTQCLQVSICCYTMFE